MVTLVLSVISFPSEVYQPEKVYPLFVVVGRFPYVSENVTLMGWTWDPPSVSKETVISLGIQCAYSVMVPVVLTVSPSETTSPPSAEVYQPEKAYP